MDYTKDVCQECGEPLGVDTYGICQQCITDSYDPCEDNDE